MKQQTWIRVPLVCGLLLAGGGIVAQAQAVANRGAGGGTSLLSTRVVYLSKAGIVADGVTDQATALQTIYNANSTSGVLEVVNDTGGAVCSSGVNVYSNTKTRTLAGSSWIMKTNSQKWLFRNAHPVKSTPTSPASPTDSNISFEGGYFDGNNRGFSANGSTSTYQNASGVYISVFGMFGVSNLTFDNVEVYDSPTYGIHCANIVNGIYRNVRVSIPAGAGGTGGHDGLHINGPASRIACTNIWVSTDDDALALNLVDNNYNNAGSIITPDAYGGYVGYGSGSDISVNGLTLAGNAQGFRVLVGLGVRADRISVNNVTGTCTSFPLVLDMSQMYTTGSIGSVTFSDINVQMLQQDSRLLTAGYPPCTVYIQAPVDILNVRNLTNNNPYDNRALILLRETISGNPAGSVSVLNVDGVTRIGNVSGQASAKLIDIRAGASVGQLVVNGLNWLSSLSAPGTLVNVASGGTLGPYIVSNSILPGNATVTAGAGTISTSSSVSNIVTLAGVAAPTTLFSDTYTRANAATLGANYIIPAGNSVNPAIVSNAATFASNNGNSFAQIAPSGTALSLGTSYTATWTGSPGAHMIVNSDASFNGYIVQYVTNGSVSVTHQAAGGSPSLYASAVGVYSGNQTITFIRSGSTLTLRVGGTQVWTGTDSSPINNTGAYLYAGGTATITYTNVNITNP